MSVFGATVLIGGILFMYEEIISCALRSGQIGQTKQTEKNWAKSREKQKGQRKNRRK